MNERMISPDNITAFLQQPFDCLLVVHPDIRVLEKISVEIQGSGMARLNLSKELSPSLIPVLAKERGRFSQRWLVDVLAAFPDGPVLCACPDLLFEPSLEIDPLALFRQAARVRPLVVPWPGEYSANTLSYAIPEHHHFRSWKISDAWLRQPLIKIHRIPDA